MKKVLYLLAAMLMLAAVPEAQAQGWLKKIKDKTVETVKSKVEGKVDDAVNKGADAVLNPKAPKKDGSAKGDAAAKSDEAGAADDYENDTRGNAEVASINGVKCIEMDQRDCWIAPLVKGGIKNYLGDVFTIEYDMLYDDRPKDGAGNVELDIMNENQSRDNELFTITYGFYSDKQSYHCDYCLTSEPSFTHKEGNATSAETTTNNDGRWHHFALSFNKRAIKFYVDGKRQINVPNAKPGAGWVTWFSSGGSRPTYMKDVVIAKGAVDLYERNETDIDAKVAAIDDAIKQSGKFVTNDILFQTAKADLLPESMEEIQKIAQYMKANPSVRFEVQGHTDNQGSDAVNDPLSQKRAEAVVKALVDLGCDEFNLRAVGKGSHEPVADNSTEDGRAKNRRVEFVKK